RVLGVLQRPVGPAVEPLRVLLQQGMVGRALDREVERDLDAVLLRVRDEAPEFLLRAELGMDGVVTALLGADRPRAAGVALLRPLGVVASLAVRVPDRMDRREVEDVEAELRKAWQLLAHSREAAPRAREELVPGAEAREDAVDVDVARGGRRLLRAVAGGGRERVVHRELLPLEQHRALGELARELGLPAGDLAAQLLLERGDPVDPGLDAEAPEPGPVDHEGAAPEVVAERLERRLRPARRARPPVADGGAERLVAVAEDPRGHLDALAGGALRRPAAAIHLRRDLLDLDPRRTCLRKSHAPSLTDAEGSKREARTLRRNPSPPDVAAVREARPRGVPLRRLARRGGPVVVAGAAARTAGRVRLAVPLALGVRGVA